MQLRKTVMMLTVASALGVLMTGCSTGYPWDQTRILTCTADANCDRGELCHPSSKVCVKACRVDVDCPESAQTCAAVSRSDSRQVCQCSTDVLCRSDDAQELVCSTLDKVCTPKCTSDASCGTGRNCDTATGQCKENGTTLACTTDADCLEGELCHPTAKACARTCVAGSDCHTSAKTCAAVSTSDSRRVCQCSTDALCNSEGLTGLVCSTLDKVCTPKCTSDASCGTGRTCDMATGQCRKPGACVGEGQSICAYGKFCSDGTCTAVPAPTCANFTPSQGGKQPVWNATTSTGPIIFDVTQLPSINEFYCSGNITTRARVKAYISSGTFPAQKDALNDLFYVTLSGTQIIAKDLIRPSEYSVSTDGKMATFIINFCPQGSDTTLSIGLYFTGGNEICAQLTKP